MCPQNCDYYPVDIFSSQFKFLLGKYIQTIMYIVELNVQTYCFDHVTRGYYKVTFGFELLTELY